MIKLLAIIAACEVLRVICDIYQLYQIRQDMKAREEINKDIKSDRACGLYYWLHNDDVSI